MEGNQNPCLPTSAWKHKGFIAHIASSLFPFPAFPGLLLNCSFRFDRWQSRPRLVANFNSPFVGCSILILPAGLAAEPLSQKPHRRQIRRALSADA